jgi:hypothetical protein
VGAVADAGSRGGAVHLHGCRQKLPCRDDHDHGATLAFSPTTCSFVTATTAITSACNYDVNEHPQVCVAACAVYMSTNDKRRVLFIKSATCQLRVFALNQNTECEVWLQVCFSLMVQASEGATFGVVPFVSKRSMGVVSGFVGAGGNAGSVITQALFFNSDKYEVHALLTPMVAFHLSVIQFVV